MSAQSKLYKCCCNTCNLISFELWFIESYIDREERHDLSPWLCLFFPLFSSLLKKGGGSKGEWSSKRNIESKYWIRKLTSHKLK